MSRETITRNVDDILLEHIPKEQSPKQINEYSKTSLLDNFWKIFFRNVEMFLCEFYHCNKYLLSKIYF